MQSKKQQNEHSLFEDAVTVARAGDLQQAIRLCQSILEQNERFSPAYSLMAEIWKVMGNLESAEKFYGLAAKFDVQNPAYVLEQIKTRLLLEKIEEAYKLTVETVSVFPENPSLYLLLADVHIRVHEYPSAVRCLEKAKSLGADHTEEMLAICEKAQGNSQEAERILQKAIHDQPNHVRYRTMLAEIFTEQKRYADSESIYQEILAKDPQQFQALLGYGNLLLHLQRWEEALPCLEKAVQQNPTHSRCYYLIGAYHFNHKRYNEAVPYLKKSLDYQPEFLAAQQMLATALFVLNRKQESLPYIERVLVKFPDHPSFTHLRATLLGENTEMAPDTYVRDLFDSYADRFDTHLVQGLNYVVPEALADDFYAQRLALTDTRKDLSLLDLGCGTGLGAERFLEITKDRIGVDLSSAMLTKAKEKQIFSELHAVEVVQYLSQSDRGFDMILATDVLVYFGTLEPFMHQAATHLNSQGYLAFSVEVNRTVPEYHLLASGRYGHNPDYIMVLAKKEGLKLLHSRELVGRTENNEGIQSMIFIFTKP